MNREFREWFIAERARALATILLTRRDDLVVKDAPEETALDFTVHLKTEAGLGNRPFGVFVAAAMNPATRKDVGKLLQPVLEQVRTRGPFQFPVCVFYFTVKDNQGYHAWAYEPVVTAEGQPRLSTRALADGRPLGNESLEEIVAAVQRWYDALYATLTSAGNVVQAG